MQEFENEKLAKVEIDAKTIVNSTVVIEYTFKVTNLGEIDGYAKKIEDYIPQDLKFNSELNKDWYYEGTKLYNTGLANVKIKSGESKEIKLILIKTMTSNNIGLIQNISEITEDYNELGIEDSNSTPGNREKDENDYSSSEVLISIRTGMEFYISILLILFIAIIIIAVTIKIKNKEEKN